jgi:hypothetical protein
MRRRYPRSPKPRTIDTPAAANRALELCNQGKAYVLKQLGPKPELLVISKSGASEIKIGARYRYMFEHGHNDGLLPGFSQTASIIHEHETEERPHDA